MKVTVAFAKISIGQSGLGIDVGKDHVVKVVEHLKRELNALIARNLVLNKVASQQLVTPLPAFQVPAVSLFSDGSRPTITSTRSRSR